LNNLSDRLNLIKDLVLEGKSVADIGTDHGYIPIELLREAKVPYAILADINEGPLKIARKNLFEANIPSKKFDLRQGNGLDVLKDAEVSSVIIAGMGGELIAAILAANINKSHSFERLILQPRTRSNELRVFLSNASFAFEDYRLVKEKERICEIFVVKPTDKILPQDTDLISKFLIKKNDPLLKDFVDHKIHSTKMVLESLKNSNTEDGNSQNLMFDSILTDLENIRKEI